MSKKSKKVQVNRQNVKVEEEQEPSDLAKVMSGRGAVPGWKVFLDSRSRERKEEGLKYAGGTTGSQL